jgi:hypothetical protein
MLGGVVRAGATGVAAFACLLFFVDENSDERCITFIVVALVVVPTGGDCSNQSNFVL